MALLTKSVRKNAGRHVQSGLRLSNISNVVRKIMLKTPIATLRFIPFPIIELS
ncbi:hypothetical protein XCR1_2750025 [Xenorhabdus cabanillasii JM26]|uniref:Uncharacterized protein n=1 Tax=Xenorhabdus cabanillasii JM26 TaxID=1427517 RepID=W1J8E0_9GAMM|nr:hypothetical protein XCR1_2750025 [Xenorhabdus cabanillasii JM26]